jgi:hypothetical protein
MHIGFEPYVTNKIRSEEDATRQLRHQRKIVRRHFIVHTDRHIITSHTTAYTNHESSITDVPIFTFADLGRAGRGRAAEKARIWMEGAGPIYMEQTAGGWGKRRATRDPASGVWRRWGHGERAARRVGLEEGWDWGKPKREMGIYMTGIRDVNFVDRIWFATHLLVFLLKPQFVDRLAEFNSSSASCPKTNPKLRNLTNHGHT